jgi:putative ABC transport system substrate-binding protein
MVNRRDFIGLIAGLSIARSRTARSQQHPIPVVGFLNARSATDTVGLTAAFRQALNEVGFVDGGNIAIEYRWASNQSDQLPALAAELVARPAMVIAAFSTTAALAAKNATTTIPIVFVTSDDPIRAGLVASLNRPGGNVSGVTFLQLGAKRLQLLRALAPKADLIAVLLDPNNPESVSQANEIQDAARALGQKLAVLRAGTAGEIDVAVASLMQQGAGALIISGSPTYMTNRAHISALMARHKIPAMYSLREFVTIGGLISYGASISESYRQAGLYVGRILRGAKPADLPVLQPTRFELVINIKAAKALGLELPVTLLALADEVIE